MSLIFDEYGRPFIILREQQQKARINGHDAPTANNHAARSVSNLLRTSLGPKGTSISRALCCVCGLTCCC
jgi:T-complex protein 1 subunit epsilon